MKKNHPSMELESKILFGCPNLWILKSLTLHGIAFEYNPYSPSHILKITLILNAVKYHINSCYAGLFEEEWQTFLPCSDACFSWSWLKLQIWRTDRRCRQSACLRNLTYCLCWFKNFNLYIIKFIFLCMSSWVQMDTAAWLLSLRLRITSLLPPAPQSSTPVASFSPTSW